MGNASQSFIVGLDNGGTMNNATVLDPSGQFLVEHMLERPSRVREGPELAIGSLAASFDQVLDVTGVDPAAVAVVGLDTPGPASADGIMSSRGGTNFGHPGWGGFNIRAALEERLGLPVVYTNDANAATLYAHYARFGDDAPAHSSVAAWSKEARW
jgi:glucokinase